MKEKPNRTTQGANCSYAVGLKSPDATKRRASPKQGSGGKGCHYGTKKQEDPYRSES